MLYLAIAVGLILHRIFGIFHNNFIENSATPHWYLKFSLGANLVLEAWVIYIAKFKQLSTYKN